jgi:exodeoxyribonuclease VII large subunit
MSVSELAFSLKRTLEETYGHVRVRGELSRVKIHTSGHLYSDLKDADSVINVVCWKGTLSKLQIRPEEGLEVVCTGRVSSYPSRSNYQLIIETMELAGQGALLKMLEDRRRKLAAEGLFAAERKKPLPFLPQVIGVVTSPTGAVIRDIMHRLNDRFPRHVLLWPVLVQGPGAAEQVAAAIRGFDAIAPGGKIPRPDVLIVARGGGSLEDLMAFNEEVVVRAAAECRIPLISAVGHETDTTLIDFAADLRAPTPTAAAEQAVPVRAEWLATMRDWGRRMDGAAYNIMGVRRERVGALAARLPDPARLLEVKAQKLDHAAHRLATAFDKGVNVRVTRTKELGALLRHPRALIAEKQRMLAERAGRMDRAMVRVPVDPARRLKDIAARINPAFARGIEQKHTRLEKVAGMLKALSFEDILKRGYAVVRDENGVPVTSAAAVKAGRPVEIQFHDGRRKAVTDNEG